MLVCCSYEIWVKSTLGAFYERRLIMLLQILLSAKCASHCSELLKVAVASMDYLGVSQHSKQRCRHRGLMLMLSSTFEQSLPININELQC